MGAGDTQASQGQDAEEAEEGVAVKGYQALTLGWDKPVRPETMLRKRTPARPHLLPFEVRKALYDLSVIERNAKAEIARVFNQHGFSKRQRANHIAKIREEFGE